MTWMKHFRENWIRYLLMWGFIVIFYPLVLFGDWFLPGPWWLWSVIAPLLVLFLTNWGVKKWIRSKRMTDHTPIQNLKSKELS